jgi:hypothetical protein
MAHKVEVLLIDDMDGSEAVETVSFGLDGADYEIDLSEKHASDLRSALQPFMEKGRRHRGAGRRRRGPAGARRDRERSAEIREWARQQGIEVSERGRIPQRVIEQYEAAH